MKSQKLILISIFMVAIAIVVSGSLAFGDEFDQSMRLTFSKSVAIPGQVLPAGTYWFQLAGHGDSLNTMQVLNRDRTKVLATLQTGTDEIVKPSGRVILTLADRSPNQTQAILSIVYPGHTDGHQFELTYSDQVKRQLSEFPKVTMKVSSKGDVETMNP